MKNYFLINEKSKLKRRLIWAEEYLDLLNGDYGSKYQYCIYCKSVEQNGLGIVHSEKCIITQLRTLIKIAE